MTDLAVNDDLDVYIDNSGDLAFATGRDSFEQEVTLALVDFYNDIVGELDPDTMLEEVRVGARRAVDEIDEIDRVAEINAQFADDQPNTITVDIIFDTGEPLSFTL